MADPTRRFDDAEADAILKRVIDRAQARGALDRGDLVEAARQLGIDADDVDDAIAEHDEQQAIEREVAAWRARHTGVLRGQAAALALAAAGVLLVGLTTSGVAASLLAAPLLGWALGLAAVWSRVRQGPAPETLASVREHELRKAERAARRREAAERAARKVERAESLRRIVDDVDEALTRGLTRLADNLGLHESRRAPAAPRRTGVRIATSEPAAPAAARDTADTARDEEAEIEAELERLRAKRRR